MYVVPRQPSVPCVLEQLDAMYSCPAGVSVGDVDTDAPADGVCVFDDVIERVVVTVDVGERVVVLVSVDVPETDAPDENVIVGELDDVAVKDSVEDGDGDCVGEMVSELDRVSVTVPVRVRVNDGVFVKDGVFDGVTVCVIEFEREGVHDGVSERVAVPERVLVKDTVDVRDGDRVTEGVPDAEAPFVTELVGVAEFDGEKLGVID